MLTATPVRNPRMTELETNLTRVPALRAPSRTWMIPTSSVSEIRATARSSAGTALSASATMSAIEPVTATVISFELVVSAATGVPITSE